MANLDAPRFLEKFVSIDGLTSFTFPLKAYQLDSTQTVRRVLLDIIGASYPIDLLGAQSAPKDAESLVHRAYIVGSPGSGGTTIDTALDDMRHKLFKIGFGKLYTLDSLGNERWAYASLMGMPQTTWKAGDLDFMGLALDWRRLSDWYGVTQYSQVFHIGTNPATVLVHNSGNAQVFNSVLTLKGTYTGPHITNSTNTFEVDTTQNGSATTHWYKIDAGQGTVLFASDSGVTYSGIFSTVTLPTNQVHLMVLEPGDNYLVVTGVTLADLLVEFYPAYD